MKTRMRLLGISGALATTVALFVAGILWPTRSAEAHKAAEVLARGADAAPDVSTIHIVAKMRTQPGNNFDEIDADCNMVPVTYGGISAIGWSGECKCRA